MALGSGLEVRNLDDSGSGARLNKRFDRTPISDVPLLAAQPERWKSSDESSVVDPDFWCSRLHFLELAVGKQLRVRQSAGNVVRKRFDRYDSRDYPIVDITADMHFNLRDGSREAFV